MPGTIKGSFKGSVRVSGLRVHMRDSENMEPYYSTLSSRILIMRTPT